MTDVQKQLLIDYAAGRPVALMARDLRCSEATVLKRVRQSVAAVDAITDYRRAEQLGVETVAAYWKIKYMTVQSVHARKRIRGASRWSSVLRERAARAGTVVVA